MELALKSKRGEGEEAVVTGEWEGSSTAGRNCWEMFWSYLKRARQLFENRTIGISTCHS